MKLSELFDQSPVDSSNISAQNIADEYHVSIEEFLENLHHGIRIEMQQTDDLDQARSIAMSNLAKRLDYYDELAKRIEPELDEVYPGQASGRLRSIINKKYGGGVTCRKVNKLLNDPDVSNFYKKRATWYKNLHCASGKQVR